MKTIILARVSSKEQEDNFSIPAQVQRLTEYAKRKELDLVKTYKLTESSTKENRKKFEKVTEYIEQSEEPIALVTDTVDRLQRDFKESIELNEYIKKGKLEIHFYRENLVIHKDSNSSDILKWDMGVMFAKSYVLQLRDNVKRSIDKKLQEGEYPSSAPNGYLNINLDDGSISRKGDRNGRKWIKINEEKQDLVLYAFEAYATGKYSMMQLAKILRKKGLTSKTGQPMSKSVLRDMITNPFYYGVMKLKGKEYLHKYEPIISKWLFNKCQDVIASFNKGTFKYNSKVFSFKGLLKCKKCDCIISTYTAKKNNRNYMRCDNCKAVHCREDVFLDQIDNVFKSIHIPKAKIEEVMSIIKENHKEESDFYQKNLKRLNMELKRIQARIEILYEDRLDGRITADEYDKRVQDYKKQEQDIYEQLKDHCKADESFLITVNYLLELANKAYELFASSQAERKRNLIQFVFANLQAEGDKLVYKLKKPFNEMRLAYKTQEWRPRQDSNL